VEKTEINITEIYILEVHNSQLRWLSHEGKLTKMIHFPVWDSNVSSEKT
jgi:hypothetical protein